MTQQLCSLATTPRTQTYDLIKIYEELCSLQTIYNSQGKYVSLKGNLKYDLLGILANCSYNQKVLSDCDTW